MTVSYTDITQVRRMVNEPTQTPYSDVTISGYLVSYDEDKYAVAGAIWEEKASALQATMYDFSADSASYKLSQVIEYALIMARKYNSKRKAISNLWTKDPEELDFNLMGSVQLFTDDNAIANDTSEELG